MNLDIEKNTTARPLTEEQMSAWRQIVLSEYPKEACAYIVGGKVIQVTNVSPEPLERFAVDPYVRFELESQGHISGFLHSPLSSRDRLGCVLAQWC